MKQLDERDYHLSNFHRELMDRDSPDIAAQYDALHAMLRQIDEQRCMQQQAIKDFIRLHKLKRVRKPKPAPAPIPRRPTFKIAGEPQGPNPYSEMITDLITALKGSDPKV